MPETIKLPPQASRTIEGLRDTGYEPTDSLEDIVDNSIAADATIVGIRVFAREPGDIVVTVADNGHGMDADGLINAMTYGSAVRSNPKSLGKFGLGLKTASTAMARQLTVVTRPEPNAPVNAATWDLDFVVQENDWLLQRPEPSREHIAMLDEVAQGGSGTLVIWEKVDRLLARDYADPGGTAARNALKRRIDELKESLALTYLRFLSEKHISDPVTIRLNDEDIQPWDPFGTTLGSEVLFDKTIDVDIKEGDQTRKAGFRLKAYSLPPRAYLSREEESEARISTRNQGFYVFREDRLLARGTWLGLRSVEPHLNLSRIDFSFDHELDSAFQIDIKKSRILLQSDLQEALRRLLTPAISEAELRYRKNQKSQINVDAPDTHAQSNNTIKKNIDGLQRPQISMTGDNTAEVKNSKGTTEIQITLPLDSSSPHVTVSDTLDEGLLWEPTVVDTKQAVLINTGHPFYERVYVPNKGNGVAIQGLDFLLWALCEAEWAVMTDDEREHMQAVRREVSRVTRKLALELPDVHVE